MPGRHRQHRAITTLAHALLIGLGVLACAALLGALTFTVIIFMLTTP
jgi:hypothetical protein